MALSGIDEQHLARPHLGPALTVVEVQRARRDDERHRDRIAMFRHLLSGLEAEPDHTHRAAVGDLFEAEGTPRRAGTMH